MRDRPAPVRPASMGDDDAALMAAARELLARTYREGRHEVATAFRLSDGSIVEGLHVEGSARRSSVCAEGVATGAAVARIRRADEAMGVVAIVSVLRRASGTWHVIEPCGVCAELLTDYWPQARVWVGRGEGIEPIAVAELLPVKRTRSGWM